FLLQAIRLSALRNCDDPLTPRIISLDPTFSVNPFIAASGLAHVDRWPEIKRALDSPPPSPTDDSVEGGIRNRRRAASERDASDVRPGGLRYTQTIIPAGRTGGAGMRVTGRRLEARLNQRERANSSSIAPPLSPTLEKTPTNIQGFEGNMLHQGRPRSDSAPAPSSGMTQRGQSVPGNANLAGHQLVGMMDDMEHEHALSVSIDGEFMDDDDITENSAVNVRINDDAYEGEPNSVGMANSARPRDLGLAAVNGAGLGDAMDEGSDVDEDEYDDAHEMPVDRRKSVAALIQDRPSSMATDDAEVEQLEFKPVSLQNSPGKKASALTAALNKHIPHLVSTANAMAEFTLSNPFTSLYASVAAPSNAPSVSLELYYPHSKQATKPLVARVRKDATVEETIGHGLYRYWEEEREPKLSEDDGEHKMSTVGWGLRIVEDDGEVDEDFPPLDREGQISKFSYGQFAIVEATEAQIRQNLAKAPHIQRRPSRVIAGPSRLRPPAPSRPNLTKHPSADASVTSLSSNDMSVIGGPSLSSTGLKGSVGLSSTLSKPVLLRVRVAASADVHFTTTISVPSDMYIADLTEVLCKKKRLQSPSSDWVLCLADLSIALPLDRTVASLEGKTDLALVRRQWAVEHGLRIGDRRGGDPSASIFKRQSEPAPLQKFGPGVADFTQTYKKYVVQRKIAIGRHERVLAIDGDYIHVSFLRLSAPLSTRPYPYVHTTFDNIRRSSLCDIVRQSLRES
ncbi:hypothetical protein TREMEDRAFT_27794, partial [Tremella mesenterica DSM 1558]|uniref:uncharacterized protein n=1 Tax=Tremella mesenterica (strain ATCC 24925 / CBS 8224 / DSM 1558 / NBRC 9311 / NRRL Y-6157 / RJB 2259-6 / UBC 559-6) TaxID=578456 RepID=UPI0003F49477